MKTLSIGTNISPETSGTLETSTTLGTRSSSSSKIISETGSESSLIESASRNTPHPSYAKCFTTNFGAPDEWHTTKLPHRNKPGLIQSINFRLADSLPQQILKQMEARLSTLPENEDSIHMRLKYESWLDKGIGCCALAKPEMAKVMYDALRHHDGKKYDLLAWSIMPNHVHVLIKATGSLVRIVQSWKSFTGRWALANNVKYGLGIDSSAEAFWMPDYWDRFIRDDKHFDIAVAYILANPVKANLPESSMAYKFTGSIFTKE